MPNRYQGPEEERRALSTYVKLRRAQETITARLVRNMTQAGLTESQFGVLEALLHLGPMCQRELAGKLLRTSGNVTMVIDNLEKRGLVNRDRAGPDRRFVTVHLTAEGRRVIKRFFPRHARAIAEEFSALTAEEQEQLAALCRKLGLARREPLAEAG